MSMFNNHFSISPWAKLGQIGNQWQLLSFDKGKPPSWDWHWAWEREYWGADDEDKTRVQCHFGVTNTEENLLAHSKKGFEKSKEYYHYWHALCKIGEKVQVIPTGPSVIVLSKNWKGKISDHSDLELCLNEEKYYFIKHVRFCCEIYSFGTRVVMQGSIEAQMGERVGSFRIANRRGKSPDRNETVKLNSNDQTIAVGDAVFRIVS